MLTDTYPNTHAYSPTQTRRHTHMQLHMHTEGERQIRRKRDESEHLASQRRSTVDQHVDSANQQVDQL